VAFNHNDHYHALMARQVPKGASRALDVGCGTGAFAGRLARRGIAVDAIDADRHMIDTAIDTATKTGTPNVTFRIEDITTADLPNRHYDFVSCLASIHHVPFDTVTRLRAALKPGGVLAILGCYREDLPAELPVSLVAVGANAIARFAHLGRGERMSAPATNPASTLPEIRADATRLLPGRTVRRLLFWRYLLVFHQS
jgi:2-polyprenyl-3-methyl-5-hydroxy-6-metoxy-1,4-benzoquinol methylase